MKLDTGDTLLVLEIMKGWWKWSIFGSLGWSMRYHVQRGNEKEEIMAYIARLSLIWMNLMLESWKIFFTRKNLSF